MADWYKEQIGPLPVGAWVAVVGGGLAIAFYARRHPSSSNADPVLIPASADLGPTVIRDGALAGVGGDSAPIPTTPPITTNADWLRTAGATLIAHGYDPLLVTRALVKFLASEQLSAEENAVVQLALRLVGVPPSPPEAPWNDGGSIVNDPPSVNPPTVVPVIASGSGFFSGPRDQLDQIITRNGPPDNYPVTVKGDDGATYRWLSPTAVAGVSGTGEHVYVQTLPGHFTDVGPWGEKSGLLGGLNPTPIYLRVGA